MRLVKNSHCCCKTNRFMRTEEKQQKSASLFIRERQSSDKNIFKGFLFVLSTDNPLCVIKTNAWVRSLLQCTDTKQKPYSIILFSASIYNHQM